MNTGIELITMLYPAVAKVLKTLIQEKLDTGTDAYSQKKIEKSIDDMVLERMQLQGETPSPLEEKRKSTLSVLDNIRSQTVLSISDEGFVATLFEELGTLTWQALFANQVEDLNMLDVRIGLVKSAIQQYHRVDRDRKRARWGAVIISIIALIGIGVLVFFGSRPNGPKADAIMPVLQIPLAVLVWSTIGSFLAILHRFNKSGDIELQDPMRWMFTRPLTGVVMGTIAYFIYTVGLFAVLPDNVADQIRSQSTWLVAFIGGFSDKFAEAMLQTLVGKFGGEQKSELITVTPPSERTTFKPMADKLFETLTRPFDNLVRDKRNLNIEIPSNSNETLESQPTASEVANGSGDEKEQSTTEADTISINTNNNPPASVKKPTAKASKKKSKGKKNTKSKIK